MSIHANALLHYFSNHHNYAYEVLEFLQRLFYIRRWCIPDALNLQFQLLIPCLLPIYSYELHYLTYFHMNMFSNDLRPKHDIETVIIVEGCGTARPTERMIKITIKH